jgi:hypothetical protein
VLRRSLKLATIWQYAMIRASTISMETGSSSGVVTMMLPEQLFTTGEMATRKVSEHRDRSRNLSMSCCCSNLRTQVLNWNTPYHLRTLLSDGDPNSIGNMPSGPTVVCHVVEEVKFRKLSVLKKKLTKLNWMTLFAMLQPNQMTCTSHVMSISVQPDGGLVLGSTAQ